VIDWLRRPAREAEPEARLIRIGEQDLPLVVRRLRHARRMTLRLSPDGSEVRISIPYWGRIGDAVGFARDRAPWLARQLEVLPRPVEIAPGCHLPLRGELHEIVWDHRASRKPSAEAGRIVLGGPRESLAGRLRKWLESEALRLAREDLAHFCARAGREAVPLALSRAQRRWGSCSAKGDIRINWRLVMAPDFVRRSVVAHEVAHLAHFDHSPAFHAALAAIYDGEIEDANRWLKAHGRSLYRLI